VRRDGCGHLRYSDCYGLLHCLHNRRDVKTVVSRLQTATQIGGHHVVCAFNSRGRTSGTHIGASNPAFSRTMITLPSMPLGAWSRQAMRISRRPSPQWNCARALADPHNRPQARMMSGLPRPSSDASTATERVIPFVGPEPQ